MYLDFSLCCPLYVNDDSLICAISSFICEKVYNGFDAVMYHADHTYIIYQNNPNFPFKLFFFHWGSKLN
jgi:hypothetical protein